MRFGAVTVACVSQNLVAAPSSRRAPTRSWSWTMLRLVPPDGPAKSSVVDAAREHERARDLELVRAAQAGDREALGALLTRHGPTIYRTVLLPRLGSEAAAKDALAECYEKVLQRIHQFEWQGVGFYPWMRTVALRVALDQLRARRRTVLFSDDDLEREIDTSTTSTPVDDAVAARRDLEAGRRRVREALDRIHERYATVIRRRILDEATREEVAAEMGVSPATFDVLLHRSIAALKKALEASNDGG